MKLAFKQLGNGRPVVILHGLFGMSDNWLNIAKALSDEYSFYLLDLRNHGRSPHSDQMNFKLMSEDVVEFLDFHNLQDITLLGHSLGGKVAMQTAAQHPERLGKLVVVDIANKVYRNSYFEEYIDALLEIDVNRIESRKEAQNAFLRQKKVEPAVLQFLLKNMYRDKDNSFKWHLNLKALKSNLENLLDVTALKSPVILDTLFMKGSESDYITSQDIQDIYEQFHNCQIAVIDGANHWVHFSAQKNFIDAFKSFQNS
jgi:esterase